MKIVKISILLSFFAAAGLYAMEGEHENTTSDAKSVRDAALKEHQDAQKEYDEKLKKFAADHKSYINDLQNKRNASDYAQPDLTEKAKASKTKSDQSFKNLEEASRKRDAAKVKLDAASKEASFDISDSMFERLAPEVAPEVVLKPGEVKLSEEDIQQFKDMKTRVLDKINKIGGFAKIGVDFSSYSDVLDKVAKAGKTTPEDRATIVKEGKSFAEASRKLSAMNKGEVADTFSVADREAINSAEESAKQVSSLMSDENSRGGKSTPSIFESILDIIITLLSLIGGNAGAGYGYHDNYVQMNRAVSY